MRESELHGPCDVRTLWTTVRRRHGELAMQTKLTPSQKGRDCTQSAGSGAREKYLEAEAGMAVDLLVKALEGERELREQARIESTQKEGDGAERERDYAAEIQEVLRNVIDSVEKSWPGTRASKDYKKQRQLHAPRHKEQRQSRTTARGRSPTRRSGASPSSGGSRA